MNVVHNRIHPTTFLTADLSFSRLRLWRASRGLEAKYGLKPENPANRDYGLGWMPKTARNTEALTWEQTFAGYVTELRPELVLRRAIAQTWGEFHADLREFGLGIDREGRGLVIRDAGHRRRRTKASTLGRKSGMPGLEARFGPFEAAPDGLEADAKRTFGPRPVTRHRRRPGFGRSTKTQGGG